MMEDESESTVSTVSTVSHSEMSYEAERLALKRDCCSERSWLIL